MRSIYSGFFIAALLCAWSFLSSWVVEVVINPPDELLFGAAVFMCYWLCVKMKADYKTMVTVLVIWAAYYSTISYFSLSGCHDCEFPGSVYNAVEGFLFLLLPAMIAGNIRWKYLKRKAGEQPFQQMHKMRLL